MCYSACTLREWSMGVDAVVEKLFTLHFTENLLIMAEDEDHLHYMLRQLDDHNEKGSKLRRGIVGWMSINIWVYRTLVIDQVQKK